MADYAAHVQDMRFVLYELHEGEKLFELPGLEDFSRDDIDMALDQAARLAREVLAPLNRPGDEQGCRFEAGEVRAPDGFARAFDLYREGGWSGLVAAPEHGGQGLPHVVETLFEEMICAANLAFTSYPGLSLGAYHALCAHAAPELQAWSLDKLASGQWTGAMCLTEPQCGTDLALARTKATPRGDGSYGIDGTKIFISAGDHDLAENILHLVLARLPDAPPGVKGLSLFLVPKFLPDSGARNGVVTVGIEHKMGIKASATCQLAFENATGWLVGEPHRGMKAMFAMMNVARLAVAVQGLGVAEAARQSALTYARDRLQGRASGGEGPPEPIIRHPDVKKMLLTQKVLVEGMRALSVWIGVALDRRDRAPEAADRARAEDFVALMTPIAKAFCTDSGVACANLAIQVFGGHGYIREHGVEQLARDARIGPIYEGTNGVQALDLVARKVLPDDGRRLREFFEPVDALVAEARQKPELADMLAAFERGLAQLREAIDQMRARGPQSAIAGASAFLRLFALVTLGYLWLRMARLSFGRDEAFYAAKLASARFYFAHVFVECEALAQICAQGAPSLLDFPEDFLVS